MSQHTERMRFIGAGLSDMGLVRTINEDRYLVDNKHGVFAVADGIGGLPHGEKASDCAIRVLQRLTKESNGLPEPLTIKEIINSVHRGVRQISGIISSNIGIGTTFTFMRTNSLSCEIGHVGDSTAFHINKRAINQLTTDHVKSNPGVSVQSGGESITSQFHGKKVLINFIGQKKAVTTQVVRFEPKPGDRILLCSDGISSAIESADIKLVSDCQKNSLSFLKALLEMARLRGGFDNATGVVIDCTSH